MAAYKSHASLMPFASIVVILLAVTGQAVAVRDVPKNTNKDDVKQPEWLFGHDGSYLIPGFGRVIDPHKYTPYTAPAAPRTGGTDGSPPRRNYIPGGDDTFVPNPGFEVPNPIP